MLRILLALVMTGVVIALIPHADRTSFSYEKDQPWKYALLTAPFDIPVMRDSVSLLQVRDSIDKHFVPFVKSTPGASRAAQQQFKQAVAGNIDAYDAGLIASIIGATYDRGILTPEIYNTVHRYTEGRVRMQEAENAPDAVATIDARDMLSPAMAFRYIDSVYTARFDGLKQGSALPAGVADALNVVLTPNIVMDSLLDKKYRDQEYLNVTGAQGVIKKGQRIVDRGEIVTQQIKTNLDTYQDMMSKNDMNQTARNYFFVGQALYILLCIALFYIYLYQNRRNFFDNVRQMTFLMTFITLFIALTIVLFENVSNGIYLVPFGALPVILMIFFDSRTAIFSMLMTVLICALVATYPFQFIFVEIAVGLAATFSIHQLSRRSQLVRTALLTFITYTIAFPIMCLVTEGNLGGFSWHMVALFGINSVILSFAYILMVVIEKVFGFTSTVTLVELSDINNPLLRRLAEEAPGTFQHSMQVSTIASEAALAIGANVQLVRTGALYHDIGKLESPIFFTENQHGINPHEGLDPEMSAKKIIGHVTHGMQLAAKNKLPSVIRKFITEHHGRSLTRYFYNTAVNNNPDQEIDKEKFRYPGPNPQSKETAILMMADAVEAASRSLKEYSASSINELVDRIVDTQQKEGLFNESPLSFRELGIIKDTFKKRLATIYHSRVQYPELKAKTAPEPSTEDAGKLPLTNEQGAS